MVKNKENIENLDQAIKLLAENERNKTYRAIIYTADVISQWVGIKASEQLTSHRTSFGILNALVAHGGSMSSTELSRIVIRTKCAVTRIIDTMVKNGLVKRVANKTDRRVKNIVITQKGLGLIEKTLPKRTQIALEATSYLKDEELSNLTRLLHDLRKHLLTQMDPNGSKKHPD